MWEVGSDAAVDQVCHVEEELKLVEEELDAKCAEECQLKGELSKLALEEEAFKDDSKVCFYTGLPSWDLLSKLFGYLRPHLGSTKRCLSPFQQLIMTLMRLRFEPIHSRSCFLF